MKNANQAKFTNPKATDVEKSPRVYRKPARAVSSPARQQTMLFWHLGQIFSRLSRSIIWYALNPIEKRRLLAVLEVFRLELDAVFGAATARSDPNEQNKGRTQGKRKRVPAEEK